MIDTASNDFSIHFEEINLADRPEVAMQYGIFKTPALVVGGELAFTGKVTEEALRSKLAAASGLT